MTMIRGPVLTILVLIFPHFLGGQSANQSMPEKLILVHQLTPEIHLSIENLQSLGDRFESNRFKLLYQK